MTSQRVLVVEDNEPLLLAIQEILEGEGYEVLTAVDGVDALEKMNNFPPDLIVADISMPRMDGYRFFEKAHERPEWVPVPFIFLTARSDREDRLRGKAMGAEDYIVKPFDPEELVVVVRSRIGRARAIREATENEFEELKQQIVTMLSHELRTPLTSVYGYTELALEEAATLSAHEFEQFLERIKKGADRLTKLVTDLMIMVRSEVGELDREFQILAEPRHDLPLIVKSVVMMHQGKANKQGIHIDLTSQPDLPMVLMHEYFVTQALDRLVDNAVKFSREESDRIEVRLYAKGGSVVIDVADQGIGIEAKQIPNLFKRFGQLDRARAEQQGAGMGLVIAQAMVKTMGGTLEAESMYGVGSTFSICLPAIIR